MWNKCAVVLYYCVITPIPLHTLESSFQVAGSCSSNLQSELENAESSLVVGEQTLLYFFTPPFFYMMGG